MVTDQVATAVPAYTTKRVELREPKPVVAVARICVAADRFSVKSTITNVHELNDPLNSATPALAAAQKSPLPIEDNTREPAAATIRI